MPIKLNLFYFSLYHDNVPSTHSPLLASLWYPGVNPLPDRSLHYATPCDCYHHDKARIEQQVARRAICVATSSSSVGSPRPSGQAAARSSSPILARSSSPTPARSPRPAPASSYSSGTSLSSSTHPEEGNALVQELEISICFTDKGLRASARMAHVGHGVDLHALPADVHEKLHLQEVAPESLLYEDADGRCSTYVGGLVPVVVDSRQGMRLSLQARTDSTVRAFPASYYIDMSERLSLFSDFVDDPDDPMTEAAAFDLLFQDAPTDNDIAALRHCLKVLEAAPPQIRQRFELAGYSAAGTWLDFVRACERAENIPDGDRNLFRSPLARRRPRSPLAEFPAR
ncbi:hypothetical protein AURDEDRAFT_177102 [Auricularia subglabra TFB-10046 SS5]|uniref:Uncharacterized protein n=1 Tax=Auricularia subglabra (strain TFB-10046 / SS5) TaxID=717982 RepID=J0WN82_AURST|nr:hypothetical protein AURDEDRAFT_177102 [Auricularia subglabra TFB-10046 SS5]